MLKVLDASYWQGIQKGDIVWRWNPFTETLQQAAVMHISEDYLIVSAKELNCTIRFNEPNRWRRKKPILAPLAWRINKILGQVGVYTVAIAVQCLAMVGIGVQLYFGFWLASRLLKW